MPDRLPDRDEGAVPLPHVQANAVANPNALVIYQPQGRDGMQMTPQLAPEFATNFLSCLLGALVLGLGAFGFGKRVGIAGVMGLFAWLVISVPYCNWCRLQPP